MNERWEDPIVAEVQRIREEIARKYNYDIHALFVDLMSHQKGTVTLDEFKAGKYQPSAAKPAMARETPSRKHRKQ